jgi:hypothetical protein
MPRPAGAQALTQEHDRADGRDRLGRGHHHRADRSGDLAHAVEHQQAEAEHAEQADRAENDGIVA